MSMRPLVFLLLATLPPLSAQSPEPGEPPGSIVVFRAGVDSATADRVLLDLGIRRQEHPDLLPYERLVRVTPSDREQLAVRPEVLRIYPASGELDGGIPVHACAGAAVEARKSVARAAVSTLEAWKSDASGRVDLTWSLRAVPEYLSADETAAAIESALAEWARHAALTFTRTNQARAWRSIDFLFGAGDHGDPYPFQGRNGVLAHGFYPAGVNPEPIAGDVHLNADETWSNGGGRDVYSVALHEIGHALGLAHSDTPGSVMYPYFTGFTTLQADDVDALLSLYSPATPAPAAPLSVTAGAARWVAGNMVELSGAVSGGSGAVTVSWSTDQYAGSVESRDWSFAVPVLRASTTVAISVTDSTGAQASTTVKVVRDQPAPAPTPAPAPSAPPAGNDRQAPSVRISSPAAPVFATSAQRIRIAGSARDNVGVAEVLWSSGGLGGTATGRASWSFEIDLIPGDNHITVTARDAAGNSGKAAILVTRR